MKNCICSIFIMVVCAGMVPAREVQAGCLSFYEDPVFSMQPAHAITRRNAINMRAVRHFTSSFPDLSGEKWYEVRKGLVVLFTWDSVRYKVAYSPRGNWKYTMLHYGEDKLPSGIKHLIKQAYGGYAISMAHELRLPGETVYQVEVQDHLRWRIIQVTDRELLEVKKLYKTDP